MVVEFSRRSSSPENGRPDRAKAVLAVAQSAVEPPVDARGDERAARQPEEFVEAAVQLARPADEPRRGDVVRGSSAIGSPGSGMSSGSCDPSASRNTVIGSPDLRNGSAHGLTLAASAVDEDPAPRRRSPLGRAVGRVSDDDDDLACVDETAPSTISAIVGASCLRGNHDGALMRLVRAVAEHLRRTHGRSMDAAASGAPAAARAALPRML